MLENTSSDEATAKLFKHGSSDRFINISLCILQGHPDMKHIPGVDMSTGSLGQGISAAVGMALSAKHFGDSFKVYAVLGDGEIEEGQVWEAAMFAGNKGLSNLTAFVDYNNLQIDGTIEEVNSAAPRYGYQTGNGAAHS